jgi:hypothetical protein
MEPFSSNCLENADGTFALAWRGEIINAGGEFFTGFSLTPVELDLPAVQFTLRAGDGSVNVLTEPEGGDFVSADLAGALASIEPEGSDRVGQEPEGGDFVIVFYTVERPGGALIGIL